MRLIGLAVVLILSLAFAPLVSEAQQATRKEQCLYLHQFQTLAEAQRLIAEFITRYNAEWLVERLGHRTPAAARAAALAA